MLHDLGQLLAGEQILKDLAGHGKDDAVGLQAHPPGNERHITLTLLVQQGGEGGWDGTGWGGGVEVDGGQGGGGNGHRGLDQWTLDLAQLGVPELELATLNEGCTGAVDEDVADAKLCQHAGLIEWGANLFGHLMAHGWGHNVCLLDVSGLSTHKTLLAMSGTCLKCCHKFL